jgi:ligand-binding sensor domain-containing protein
MNENLINLILSVKNYLLIILFLGVSIIYLNAQKSEYEYDHFTAENGLPDDFIFDFDTDKNGNLWLSTRLGISIYDGFNFTPVTAIPNEVNYRSIRFDKTGRLWLISNIYEFSVDVTDKVTLYDPKTELINSIDEVFPEIKKILSQSNNYTLKTDSDNNLYMLGAKPSPIIYLEDEKIKTYQTEYETNYLSLFVKTPYTMMSRHVDGDTLTFKNIKTGERRKYYTPNTNYAIELNNEIIIKGEWNETSGQNKYISTITSPGMKNTDLLSNPYFQHIHEDEKIILATFDKLLVYNFKSRTKYNLSNKISSSIEHSAISRILKTDENIWVSTSYGLYKIYKNNKLFNTNLSGTQLSVRNIYYAGDNKIFVCTERGIYEIDLLTGTEELLVDDLQAYTITKIDSSRYIIGSPSKHTQKWDFIKNEFISSQPKYPKDYIPSTGSNIFYHKDKNGNYWVLNNTSLSNYYPDQDSFQKKSPSITSMSFLNILRKYFSYFTLFTIAVNTSGWFIAISASTFLFKSISALFNAWMKVL